MVGKLSQTNAKQSQKLDFPVQGSGGFDAMHRLGIEMEKVLGLTA